MEWLCLMRIEPFDRVYAVLQRGSPCPRCRSSEARGAPATWTECTWPGGTKLHCTRCGTVWLQLDSGADRELAKSLRLVESNYNHCRVDIGAASFVPSDACPTRGAVVEGAEDGC